MLPLLRQLHVPTRNTIMSSTPGTLPKDLKASHFRSPSRPEQRKDGQRELEAKIRSTLEEAAELGAWLTSDEVAMLVNVLPLAVRLWRHGHRPRPGYRLTRRQEGRQVWWRVNREH